MVLINVLPVFFTDNQSDVWLRYAKSFSDLFLRISARCVKTANSTNILIGQFGMPVLFALLICGSIFGNHIRGIVRMSSKEKMIWIAAAAIVAMMAYKQTVGDWPISQYPRHSMSVIGNLILRSKPIANIGNAFCPFPTFIGRSNIYSFPKISRIFIIAYFFYGLLGLPALRRLVWKAITSAGLTSQSRPIFSAGSRPERIIALTRRGVRARIAATWGMVSSSIHALFTKIRDFQERARLWDTGYSNDGLMFLADYGIFRPTIDPLFCGNIDYNPAPIDIVVATSNIASKIVIGLTGTWLSCVVHYITPFVILYRRWYNCQGNYKSVRSFYGR